MSVEHTFIYSAYTERIVQIFKQPPDLRSAAAVTLAVAVVTWLGVSLVSEWLSPLRGYPGHPLARWTNLWRFFLVRTGDYHLRMQELHDKYGPVVRIGPNLLDLDYPELIKTLYGTDGKWRKTEFYHNNSAVVNGKTTYHLFSQTDHAEHARMKRPIAKYYSQSSLATLEPLMDKVVRDFCKELDTRFAKGPQDGVCDLGEWIAFYAWDMVGAATMSQRFGYMDKGHDFDGSIGIADQALDYFAAVGQMPFLDFLLDKNPVARIGPPNLSNVTRIALDHLVARLQGNDKNFDPEVPDFLQHFLDAKQAHPEVVDDGTIVGYMLVNLIAGADTTAITVRAIFDHVLRNPDVYRRLKEEVTAAGFGQVASFSAARSLPYLEAVVREATRIHPGVCMLLERYVPASGLTLPDGRFIPAGAAVGINPYVVHRNRGVWGDDADVFRPERWLPGPDEDDEAYRQRLKAFNAADLTFGAGSHICIGRNFALMEVYKITATLMSRYDIELVDPERKLEVTGSWFCRQKGLVCRLNARD
ncbi:cytochrome P450 [Pestalotiopsis sp. NC0098]|nr:cytochrome P450 [Pestalotiopsis sp. NC0098]